ncbi:MAG: asparagine synthase (glutamine-hydrolyzing) [Sedimentisphaerales bacterium]|nr:asparagine synthase (glutamine-hydrolyzing) [Sedimentisphaerales bacterium]
MCGILGFNWEDRDRLVELAGLLEHRGPEQEGYHVGDGVSIGHKRLCILDLSEKGIQPMYNENRNICVSYNGEIYNFKELRKELEGCGHIFKSNTDTEVLVHGYEQWGREVLSRLNGQFAFCILDVSERKLLLGRDRLGIKPLYYYCKEGKFIFGSELKVMLKSGIEKQIDEDVLDHYMIFGYTPSEDSILCGVKKLLPGSWLEYDLGKKELDDCGFYWELNYCEDHSISEMQWQEQLRELISRSTKRRLISDVPLGAFLSGGIDSSIIVAMMREHVSDLQTFSIRFDHKEFNESQYAKIVSEMFGTNHFEIEFDSNDVGALIPGLIYNYDEPFSDPSMIPTYLVSKVAKEHVTVSLSGTGGDELFGGYERYSEFSTLKRLNSLPGFLKMLLNGSVCAVNTFLGKDKLNKLRCFLGEKSPGYILYVKLLSYMFRGKGEGIKGLEGLRYLNEYFNYDNDLTNLLNTDMHEYLPNDLLVKEDRASTAVSLEARVPFLDHELVEFAAKMPASLKIRGGEKKYILKKSFEGVLPKEILYRKKRGFGVPLVHYFRGPLKDFAYGEIFDFEGYNYYDKNMIRKMWDRHQSGRSDYSRILWSVIVFNMWFNKWMK